MNFENAGEIKMGKKNKMKPRSASIIGTKILKQIRSKQTCSQQIFSQIQDLNWAWIHRKKDGSWEQFDCVTCMMLETKY